MNKKWWKETVVYQIYPRSFMDSNNDGIGDLKGITSRLDYLKKLGVDVIWISPIFKSPNVDNGYDVSDYEEIMSDFGTMDDFDELLKKAHGLGIKIMLDLVVNHSSDEHEWFIESRSSRENSKRDYYIWRKGKENGKPPSNWGAAWGDSAWKYDEQTGEYYLHIFHEKQPDLNWENPTLREEIYKIMRFWLDKGIDGFRMDVINFISKHTEYPDGFVWNGNQYGDSFPFVSNGPKIHDYLKEMNEKVLRQYDIITVGEMPGVTTEQAKLYTGEERNELNMVFHFEHVDIGNGKFGKWTPNNWKLSDLKKIFNKWQKELENSGWNSLYWSNHDQPRAVSRWVKTNDNNRETASKMLGTCLHMMKGTPYIYQGEEIGMTNVAFDSIDKYRDVETLNAYKELVDHQKLAHEEMMRGIYQRSRDNARTPMQWNDSEHSGFTKGVPWMDVNPNYQKINVENALKDPNSIFYYYQKLIGLRKKHPIIVHGRFESMMDEDEQIFAYKRILENEVLLVICNFMDCPKNFEMPDELKNKKCEVIITNAERSNEILDSFELKPFEATVFNIK